VLRAPGTVADAFGFHVMVAQRLDAGERPTPQGLREHCERRLPAYMVPASFTLLPALPLSGNGKVDRAALAATAPARDERAYEPPRDDAERLVAAIWQEVLGCERVGRDDSFFALGGHSLALIQAHNRLRRQSGADVPVADLFTDSTPAAVARLLGARRGPAVLSGYAEALVPIQEAGERPPLFVVPGVISAPHYLVDFARDMGADQPLYGFQAPGLEGGVAPLATIEEHAALYREAMRRVQPHGPYFLCGHSFGGYPAFELAQQLLLAGEEVALLSMVDTVVIRGDLAAFRDADVAKESIVRAYYAGHAADIGIPYEDVAKLPPQHRLELVLERLRGAGKVASSLALDGLVAVFQANMRAMADYVPVPYPGGITLLRTVGGFPAEFLEHEPGDSLADPALGWTDLADEDVEVVSIPGDHLTMMVPPQRGVVAAEVRRAMDRRGAGR
jgi:thioesterase domain-containing protein